jgi:hypothetical protein
MRNFFLNNHGSSKDEKCAFNRLKREFAPFRDWGYVLFFLTLE